MHPERGGSPRGAVGSKRAKGFALVAALSVMVLLSLTGALMVRLTGLQQAGVSSALLGHQAHWAARAGIEWAIHELDRLGNCPAATTTFSLTEGGLSGFTVIVRCSETTHREGSTNRSAVQVEAEASYGAFGTRNYVFRQIAAAAIL